MLDWAKFSYSPSKKAFEEKKNKSSWRSWKKKQVEAK